MRLADAIETEARSRGVTALYLLTTTAAGFFERLGYTVHDRTTVQPTIAASAECSSLSSDTARCLKRDLSTLAALADPTVIRFHNGAATGSRRELDNAFRSAIISECRRIGDLH